MQSNVVKAHVFKIIICTSIPFHHMSFTCQQQCASLGGPGSQLAGWMPCHRWALPCRRTRVPTGTVPRRCKMTRCPDGWSGPVMFAPPEFITPTPLSLDQADVTNLRQGPLL